MKKYLYIILFMALVIVACNQENINTQLVITAGILEGEFFQQDGKIIIQSSNTLQMENYFVWGGSAIKGKDCKYHMLFSLWECGEKWAPFQDGWLLNSKIASAEDPYVWFHKNNNRFYAIFKDFSGKITDAKPGLAILISNNGINWQKPEKILFL